MSNKDNSNYMLIQLNTAYSKYLILPYADGIALLSSLHNAKMYETPYNNPSTISDLQNNDVKTTVIGAQEYGESILRSAILGKEKSE